MSEEDEVISFIAAQIDTQIGKIRELSAFYSPDGPREQWGLKEIRSHLGDVEKFLSDLSARVRKTSGNAIAHKSTDAIAHKSTDA